MPSHEASAGSGGTHRSWVALLGRRDFPTDGVEDYCGFLAEALSRCAVNLTLVRVNWADQGWTGGWRQLRRESAAWRGRWVLLQYTALSWSRRGFPLPVLVVIGILRRNGAKVAVVFHDEANRQSESRWIDRIRGACQAWVIRRLCQGAAKAIFPVPLETVRWLPKENSNSEFIPIGANIPERLHQRLSPAPLDGSKTVIVFGVTGAPGMAREVEEIGYVMREAAKTVKGLHLVVVGRGSCEARHPLEKALAGSEVELVIRGVLPAEEVASEFDSAHAFLFVRSPISHRRGSALAGIATGVPIIGYGDAEAAGPIKDAGIEWSSWGDRDGLVRDLIRVLSDPQRWACLHERSLQVQKNALSWSRIAARFQAALST